MKDFYADIKPAIMPDIPAPPDSGETVSSMEPMRISESLRQRAALADLAVELAAFTQFFLETCLDQVKFMEDLVQPDRLRTRILM